MPNFTTDEITGDNIQKNILQKLNGLGFRGITVKPPISGPIVTAYPLTLPAHIDIKKILNQTENIALATGVEESVDIRRVGNELMVYVPNREKRIVDFKEAMYWFLQDEKVRNMRLPILIGQDTVGNNKALDLAEQPHVLIAGSTGAGKSVFLSNIIASLVMMHNPNELELDLIDTKGLDLTLYESLPHVCNLVESIDDWYLVIDRLIGEVSHRNLKLKKKGVRNIAEYNSIVEPNERMSYVVVIIDELADLMEKDKEVRRKEGKEHANSSVTDSIKRLISICRASGMHIIGCTQRTSVDVVSGTIKGNFPTRISLKLPSGVDSRVILGQNGAENLLGKGDMLIQENDSDLLKRYHSPFIRIEDVRAIMEHKEMILEQLARPRLG